MATTDPRVDAIIAKSAPFAQPILTHLRNLVHLACPDVKETVKWGFPCFDYNGMFCNMAPFKHHCTFGFWKAKLLKDPHGILTDKMDKAMGCLGRITSITDLPTDAVILAFIKEAKRLNDDNIKPPPREKITMAQALDTPTYMMDALMLNQKAIAQYETFTPGKKKEYIEWVTEAKTEATRHKRLATAIEWIGEGKGRNWKYEKC